MTDQDWSRPTGDVPVTTRLSRWKVDHEERDAFEPSWRIYEVPETVANVRNPMRLVAKCEKKSDAELIVSLYEQHREEVS